MDSTIGGSRVRPDAESLSQRDAEQPAQHDPLASIEQRVNIREDGELSDQQELPETNADRPDIFAERSEQHATTSQQHDSRGRERAGKERRQHSRSRSRSGSPRRRLHHRRRHSRSTSWSRSPRSRSRSPARYRSTSRSWSRSPRRSRRYHRRHSRERDERYYRRDHDERWDHHRSDGYSDDDSYRPRRQDPSTTILVQGLPTHKAEQEIGAYFGAWAPVQAVRVVRDRATNLSRGLAYVDFATLAAAKAVLDQSQQYPLVWDDMQLAVEFDRSSRNRDLPSRGSADWLCESCGGVNFARRMQCYQCNAARPEHAQLANSGSSEQPSNTLVIRGLDMDVTEDEVNTAFSQYAAIKELRLVRDRRTGLPRGFAFITFYSVQDATFALAKVVAPSGLQLPRQQHHRAHVAYARDAKDSAGPSQLAAAAIEAAQFSQQYARNSGAHSSWLSAPPASWDAELAGWAPKEFGASSDPAAVDNTSQARVAETAYAGAPGHPVTGNPDGSAARHARSSAQEQQPAQAAAVIQIPAGFVYDAASGYYMNADSGYYYDANSGLYYHGATSTWYRYDFEANTYVAYVAPEAQETDCDDAQPKSKERSGGVVKAVSTVGKKHVDKDLQVWSQRQKEKAADVATPSQQAEDKPKGRGASIGASFKPNTQGLLAAAYREQQLATAKTQPAGGKYRDRAAERRALHTTQAGGGGLAAAADDDDPVTVSSSNGALRKDNVGGRMRGMGWRDGEGLGKHGTGVVEPVFADSRNERAGLGSQSRAPADPRFEILPGDSYRVQIQKKAMARFNSMLDQ
eukprot:jgi/Chlat1/4301/Chrsp29S04471